MRQTLGMSGLARRRPEVMGMRCGLTNYKHAILYIAGRIGVQVYSKFKRIQVR